MSNPSETPFIEINNGKINVWGSMDKILFGANANRTGAKKVGHWLQKQEYTSWLYSSSIDFPHEYGGSRINFRAAIAEGAEIECFDPINFGEKP